MIPFYKPSPIFKIPRFGKRCQESPDKNVPTIGVKETHSPMSFIGYVNAHAADKFINYTHLFASFDLKLRV